MLQTRREPAQDFVSVEIILVGMSCAGMISHVVHMLKSVVVHIGKQTNPAACLQEVVVGDLIKIVDRREGFVARAYRRRYREEIR